jgi:hypothetical protein
MVAVGQCNCVSAPREMVRKLSTEPFVSGRWHGREQSLCPMRRRFVHQPSHSHSHQSFSAVLKFSIKMTQ